MLELELKNEEATSALAGSLAGLLQGGDVIGLEGGLGAGKTTFARSAFYRLGVSDEIPVTSPTFSLLHQYEGRFPIGHADLYRLTDEVELEELGLDEMLEDGAVLFVEWCRKFPAMAARTVLWVEFEIVAENVRRVRLYPQGARGDAIISALAKDLAR
jgi:tRNA threonylcarbamoyl adenosine modification protein YjeE